MSAVRVKNRLDGPIDGALHLLDRQVLDSDGRMLGKVDDIELTRQDDGLAITALLTGTAALLERLGGKHGNLLVTRWEQLRVAEPHRARPWRIEVDKIGHLDSAVHLSVPRDGCLRRNARRRRLGTLTGMDVLGPDGAHLGRVLDARFEKGQHGRLVLRSLLVGRGRPGSLLGYDRHRRQGPWLVGAVVRRLHRHTGVVSVDSAKIRWNKRQVQLTELPDPELGHPFER
jgi:sporulation protein YlmC with PRC-barrel domain